MRDLVVSQPINQRIPMCLSSPTSSPSSPLSACDMEAGEGSSSSGGGDNTKRKYPTGFRFKPQDQELVEFYLLPKLEGKPSVPNDAIIEADVYKCHPGLLINESYKDKGVDDVWYFLSPRFRKYPNGNRPSRRTADNRGRWKPSSGKENKSEDTEEAVTETKLRSDGTTIKYCRTSLAYHVGPPKNEKKTKWLMHEFTIPEYEIKSGAAADGDMTLDRYTACKIYISNLHKNDEDDWDASAASEEAECSSSSEPGAPAPESCPATSATLTTLSKKQEGKRPAVEEQPLCRATETKRARQLPTIAPGAPPASMPGNVGVGMGAPLRIGTAGYGNVPGLQAPIPWPPVTSSSLQGPVQLQQRVYQYNGRPVAVPVQWLPGSSSQHPPSPVPAHNHNSLGRTTVMRPPLPPSSGSGQTMMRPQNGLNLAARPTLPPQSAAQPLRQLTPPPSPAAQPLRQLTPPLPPAAQPLRQLTPPPSPAAQPPRQLTPPPPPAAQPLPQLTGVDWSDPRSQWVISQLIAESKAQAEARSLLNAPCAEQQQFPTASNLPAPPPQQPTFNASANHPARADATVAAPDVGGQQQQQQPQPQQSSPAVAATSVSGPDGAAAPADEKPASENASTSELPVRGDKDGGKDKEALDRNSQKIFAELATMTLCQAAPGWGNVKEEDK